MTLLRGLVYLASVEQRFNAFGPLVVNTANILQDNPGFDSAWRRSVESENEDGFEQFDYGEEKAKPTKQARGRKAKVSETRMTILNHRRKEGQKEKRSNRRNLFSTYKQRLQNHENPLSQQWLMLFVV